MEVFHQLEEIAPHLKSSAVAIGNFDGVHLGHAALLRGVCEDANQKGAVPTVLTFFPHPVEVLNPSKKLERLTTTSEKLEQLEKLGVRAVLVAPFNHELAALAPFEFYRRFLVQGMAAISVHVGSNFRFGRSRAGDTAMLKTFCEADAIELHALPAFEVEGEKVSSSTIRNEVREGDIRRAAIMMGRPYSVSGQVIPGDQRGAQLGFPTANVHFPVEKVLPKRGVYFTRAQWQGQWYPSVTNVGIRPTFTDSQKDIHVEVHLLDFSARLYDEWLKVEFIARLRDEKKFDSIDLLREQIRLDVESARKLA